MPVWVLAVLRVVGEGGKSTGVGQGIIIDGHHRNHHRNLPVGSCPVPHAGVGQGIIIWLSRGMLRGSSRNGRVVSRVVSRVSRVGKVSTVAGIRAGSVWV